MVRNHAWRFLRNHGVPHSALGSAHRVGASIPIPHLGSKRCPKDKVKPSPGFNCGGEADDWFGADFAMKLLALGETCQAQLGKPFFILFLIAPIHDGELCRGAE